MRAPKQAAKPPARSAPAVTTAAAPGSSCSLPPARNGGHTLPAPLAGRILQPKLQVGRPDDALEQEADRIADQVLRMPDAGGLQSGIDPAAIRPLSIQRMCSQCEEELHRRHDGVSADNSTAGLGQVDSTLQQPGRPLDPAARAFFEPRFGVDFSAVRIHTDTQAAESARAVSALAYTVGRDVVFNTGQYAPHSDSGRRLLAHELTHVVQQRGVASPGAQPGRVSRQQAPPEGARDGHPSWREPAALAIGHPGAAIEAEADRVALRAVDTLHPGSALRGWTTVRRVPGSASGADGVPAPRSVSAVLGSPGRPLEPGTQARMAPASGMDLSAVRIHDDASAALATADVKAVAWTVGNHIAFSRGAYRPGAPGGDRLIAHELAHVAQQRRSGIPMLARSVEDWMQSTPAITTMPYTELVLEADELQQWLSRQTTSSPESSRIEEVLPLIRREIASRDAQAIAAGRPPARSPRRRSAATPAAPTPRPAQRPEVLTRMSSVPYADPAEMRSQYDLIMQWLATPDLPGAERRILEAERGNLAVLLQDERQRAAGARQAARLSLALTPAQSGQGSELGSLANVIEGIAGDTANPDLFWIYDRGERIPISRAQRDSLHTTLHDELARARTQMSNRVDYYWGRYQSQREVNAEYPIVSAISGWLGGVSDPGAELARRRTIALARLETLGGQIDSGRLREAGAMLAGLERDTQVIRAVARAFYEGYIDGAETAVTVLEITRDVSFAVAASIGAVVAAPFVAGVVAGAGATGTLATGLTIVGTGTVVGTGTGLVRGGSAALGVGVAGGSADEALAALRSEGTRGFVDGFVAGAGGSAARALAPALVARLGGQVAGRVATQMIVNGGAAVIDSLANGASIGQAVQSGLTAAVLSIPGGLIGSDSRLSRQLLGPLTNSATAYVGALANGAPPDQARRAAIVALATGLSTGGLVEGRESEIAGYYQSGRQVGVSARSTAVRTTAAVMIGLADAVPPVRTVGGATTTTTISQPADRPAVTSSAPVVVAAPASTTAQVPATTAPAATQQATATVATLPGATTTTAQSAQVMSAATFATSVAPAIATTTQSPAPAVTAQAPTTVASSAEAALGMSASQRAAARGAFSGNLTSPDNAPLGAVWNQVANPGEAATLTAANSRRLFNNHRNRFWRAVRRNPAALQLIRNMGGTFPEERNGGALDPNATSVPEINLAGGVRLRISLDHEVERQTAPNRALDPNNLRLSTVLENTVLLRQLHDQDPFNNPPPNWTPGP